MTPTVRAAEALGRFADVVPRVWHFAITGTCVVVTILAWGCLYHLNKRHQSEGEVRTRSMLLIFVTTGLLGLLGLTHAVAVANSSHAVQYYPEAGCFAEAILLLLLSLWTGFGITRRRVFMP